MNAKYFPRLMAVLEQATDYGGTLVVREGKFVLNFQGEEHILSPFYDSTEDYVWHDTVDCVEAEVASYKAMLAELAHKRMLRSAALAKLTDEEAEALGVSKF